MTVSVAEACMDGGCGSSGGTEQYALHGRTTLSGLRYHMRKSVMDVTTAATAASAKSWRHDERG